MTPSQPSAAAIAASKNRAPPSNDKLEKVRTFLREARDIDKHILDLEAQVKEKKARKLLLTQKDLPDLFDEAGIDSLGLPAEGNLPAYDCELGPYYHANIGAEWPTEDREKAFAYLEKKGASDLIKSTYVVLLPRGKRALAIKVETALKKLGVEFSEKLDVPWNTLTAWLKEQVQKHKTTPELDLLGATVGRVVKLKERK
jgi:hypothetical protein